MKKKYDCNYIRLSWNIGKYYKNKKKEKKEKETKSMFVTLQLIKIISVNNWYIYSAPNIHFKY